MMIALDRLEPELEYLLNLLSRAKAECIIHESIYEKILDYVFEDEYMEWFPDGQKGGFSYEDLKKWLRSMLAVWVKSERNGIFIVICPKCETKWYQGPRRELFLECPFCSVRIDDPEVLEQVPDEEKFPFSLDGWSDEERAGFSEKEKDMITFNEGFSFGEAVGVFTEREKCQHIAQVRNTGERIVEVPVSEAEIIEQLKREKGISNDEILVAVPKFSALRNSEARLLAVLFGLDEKAPVTQQQLAGILGLTQPRVSQMLRKFEGNLVQTARIKNPDPSSRRRFTQGYYIPLDTKEKLAKTVFQANMLLRDLRPIVNKHPDFEWIGDTVL
jgi:DNA-binding MarR family transcriptional regulator